jgi:hypothetical protein
MKRRVHLGDDIKIDHKEILILILDSPGSNSEQGRVADSCEHGSETSSSIKGWEFLDKLSVGCCQLFKAGFCSVELVVVQKQCNSLFAIARSQTMQCGWLVGSVTTDLCERDCLVGLD